MSRFRKPVDISDDEEERLVRAKPIDPKFVRKLGDYGLGKDFVRGSAKSQHELRGEEGNSQVNQQTSSALDTKSRLELRNKLASKILKAKLQSKMDLVEKLEEKLRALDSEENASVSEKILYETRPSGVQMPAFNKHKKRQNIKGFGAVETAFRADESIREMISEEKSTSYDDSMLNAAKIAAKNRTDDDWVVDDAMLSVKRKRKNEEKEAIKNRKQLIRGLYRNSIWLRNLVNAFFYGLKLEFFKFSHSLN